MALGNLDINTMERIDDFNPDATNVKVLALGRMINITVISIQTLLIHHHK